MFIADWVSMHNHETGKDEDIPGMCISIDAIETFMNIQECMRAGDIREAMLEDEHLSTLAELMQLAIHKG